GLLAKFTLGKGAAAELVFGSGAFSARLSRVGKLPAGARVTSLADAFAADGDLVAKHLSKHAAIEQNPFVALNTGFLNDGAVIYLPAGTTLEPPIHLLILSTRGGRP